MSWGPRARANHHYRKEWGRHVRRQVRAQESAPKSRSTYRAETASVRPGSRPTHDAGPLFVPRPRPETDRDERYAIGARNVFFWTLGALLLSGFLPGPIRLGSLLFPVLVLEAVIWAIYQAQFNAACREATDEEQTQAEEEAEADCFGTSDMDQDILARHAAQSAHRAVEADEQAKAKRKAEAIYQQMLDRQKQDAGRARVAKGVKDREEAVRRQVEASQEFRAKAKQKQGIVDQELRWMRDAKHGKFGQGAVGEHDLCPSQSQLAEASAQNKEARRA